MVSKFATDYQQWVVTNRQRPMTPKNTHNVWLEDDKQAVGQEG